MENLNLELLECYIGLAVKIIIKIALFFTIFLCVAKAYPRLEKVWGWSVTFTIVAIMYLTLGCTFAGAVWFIIYG